MWIERETLRNALITVYGVSPETIGESLTIAKDSPETKESARKAFAGMWKALEDESFEIVAEELMKELPKSDKPN